MSDLLLSRRRSDDKLWVDDVFSTHLYSGNGTTQTINNGIALADGLSLKPGDAFGGGYYTGQIKVGADIYVLVTAPKSAEATLTWKPLNDLTPGTLSVIDGFLNTNNMNNAQHPAAKHCRDYRGGGHDDWYLSAKDELELQYRVFKPTTTSNITSSGANSNSVPISVNYTSVYPSQTAATAFKSGGTESFNAVVYWTSTENAYNSAFNQHFSNGLQSTLSKNGDGAVRPVRRVLITDSSLDPYRVKGHGGLVWVTKRSGGMANRLVDTVRGVEKAISTNSTNAEQTSPTYINGFNPDGFSVGTNVNELGVPYASWTFRKAPKFFDIVTYTGNGVAGRQIPHELGIAPGMIIVKRIDSSSVWRVWHRAVPTGYGTLNTTDRFFVGLAENAQYLFGNSVATVSPDSANFTVSGSPGGAGELNAIGAQYVAYLFAHDDSEDGIIQCGNFTSDSGANATVHLGWEPQYVLVKRVNSASDWYILDTMRGMPAAPGNGVHLAANTSAAEVNPTSTGGRITPSGFTLGEGTSQQYIYLAIRRPNKPPTSGTEVYNAIARTGTGVETVISTSITPDMSIIKGRNRSDGPFLSARLTSNQYLLTSSTSAATTQPSMLPLDQFQYMNGMKVGTDNTFGGTNASGWLYINHFFRRAPGFFDIVCYTGTGVARTVPHGLGVAPELIIVKRRNGADSWSCGTQFTATDYTRLLIQGADTRNVPFVSSNDLDAVSEMGFGIKADTRTNGNGSTYVAYLFASLPGISKVGSYTGNGTAQTIPCGFTTGARFILIKRTDAAGDWYVWDSARGIVAANDPHLSLNTTAAEVTTDDSVDPYTGGFIVNQVAATNINVSGGTYIFLAVA